MVEANSIRVRLAPSPTGKLHIGTARTALFNYLFARKNGGQFILRLEDTDKARSTPEFAKDIIETLKWLGLEWDEGPEVGGQFGPYVQSERADKYHEFVEQLLSTGQAYRCFCTPEELEAERKATEAKGEAPRYSGKCRHLTAEEAEKKVKDGAKFAVRLILNEETIEFSDLIRGPMKFEAKAFGDFVIVRNDGTPLFLLTNVVDDYQMNISHVLRGEDHLTNTAKQIIIAKALNIFSPQFGHFPLILAKNRSKMSKRRDPVSVSDDFRAKGYLSYAILNYLALLGWSPGDDREIFSLDQLISEFEIEKVGKSPAVFDPDKLLWFNGYYIRHRSLGEVAIAARDFIKDAELKKKVAEKPEYFLQAVALVQERLKTLDEIDDQVGYMFTAPEVTKEVLVAKGSSEENAKKALATTIEALPKAKNICQDDCEFELRQAAKHAGLKDGELLWTVRAALSGRAASPGAFELLTLFGMDESIKRLQTALKALE